ncbi:Cytochrome c oxidase assembly factor 6 [Cyphellophora attinorum]|uniref:Cytochrome c oxidase assembly factor 6 n=1 Tax=Cyphellophora attinorum TaxID=1664694 RepID=A0A0N1H608_9EURO|nr:Cytochrome c oxidase assembly factor 6 [Phialophora attinorum]KPI41355.1 Cytochrome c oxidase assembly factor 6 [Phialophora attinorum]
MAYGLPDWLTGGPSTTSSANPKGPPRSNDGGYIAPDRTKREVCYESRDIFFKCLDKHDILDAVKDDEKARQSCPEEVTAYERDCARSWIKYFKEKRVVDWKRDQTIAAIQEEDAKAIAKAKEKRGGWF